MKKLLMALGVVVSAMCTQAAAVDWKVTGTVTEVNYSVYLLVSDAVTTTWSSAADVAKAAISSGTIVSNGRSYVANGTAINSSLTKSSSFYYIIVTADESKYAVSDLYSGSSYVYNNEADPPESASDIPVFAANTASYSNFSGSVPEPTSGLLMLVGLAGLALRRKRA